MAGNRASPLVLAFPLMALALLLTAVATFARPQPTPFLAQLHTIGVLASTVPSNGDINPYGVAVVPQSTGTLVAGNVLVSNFNNATNAQGTGTTIVQGTPGGPGSQVRHIAPSPSARPGGVGPT